MQRSLAACFAFSLYSITCLPNGRRYIGRTATPRKRIGMHMCQLRCEKHFNSAMQQDFKTYGEASFTSEIIGWYSLGIESCDAEAKAIVEHAASGEIYNRAIPNPEKIRDKARRNHGYSWPY